MSVVQVLPPSPPTTSSRKRPTKLLASFPITSTPEDSPASGPESSSLGSRKRVEFHPFTNTNHPSDPSSSSLEPSDIRPLPPSRECQSAGRPILKPTPYNERGVTGTDGLSAVKVSMNAIMESVIQQLASNDNTVSVDAYQTLASTIKTYDELPDEAVLKSKLNTITKCIRQHLGLLDKSDGQLTDINLVTSALKVAVILVWSADFSVLLNDDFRIFVTDRAIQVITEHTAPKSVIIHYLHLLATQDFRPGILTSNNRASRLIDALTGLTDYVKGNGVVSERLLVFAKLLDQARPVMKAKANLWVESMVSGIASNIPDTRGKALALARKACQAFPPSNSISNAMRFSLDMKQESGKTLGACICRRLEKMIIAKDDAAQVPQIWAVILLLVSNASTRIDSWSGLKEWLMVIQRCFNGSDAALRQQANMAWNRFVFVARPFTASENLMSMLAKPITAQLERQDSDKASKNSHSISISSYCNLLYYAFRPATSHTQYTRAWNEYIVKVMRSSLFQKHPANADIASRILMALLWDTKASTKVWNENRAHENRLVEPEELPTIDCKWIRSRCAGILEIFDVLFKHSSWGLPGSADLAFVSKAWRHMMKALRDAGSKEIKMSNETRSAITSVLHALCKLWSSTRDNQAQEGEGSHELSIPVLTALTMMTISELGMLNTIEILALDRDTRYSPLLAVAFRMLKEDLPRNSLSNGASLMETMGRCLTMANSLLISQYATKELPNTSASHSIFAACQILGSLPSHLTSSCLLKLAPGLSCWLTDEQKLLSGANEPIKRHDKRSPLDMLTVASMKTLAVVPAHEVEMLDEIFAAAFCSTHNTIVNAMAVLWNNKFGNLGDLRVGPQLNQAITRLRPYVELDLPMSWKKDEHNQQTDAMLTYESQEAEHNESHHETGQRQVQSGLRDEAIEQSYESTNTRQQTKLSRKHRHDDSQVEFIQVASSPPAGVMEESQYLTDHQREVRDARRSEPAVVFADLRSSPRARSSRSQSRDCEFARKAASMPERPATPTFPDQNEAGDDGPVPSPTPKSRLLRAVTDTDVPSSPPSMQGRATDRALEENMSSPPAEVGETEDQEVQFESPATIIESVSPVAEGESHHEYAEMLQHRADEDLSVKAQPNSYEAENKGENDAQGGTARARSLSQPGAEAEDNASAAAVPKDCLRSNQINSDELNDMSATQLSNDLDWALEQEKAGARQATRVQHGRAAQDHHDDGNTGLSLRDTEDDTQGSATSSQRSHGRKRKRVTSGYADHDRRHRRKKTVSRSQSEVSQEHPAESVAPEDETHDEIVVRSSSPVQAGVEDEVMEDASQADLKREQQQDFTVEISAHSQRRFSRPEKESGRRKISRLSSPRSTEPKAVESVTDALNEYMQDANPNASEALLDTVEEPMAELTRAASEEVAGEIKMAPMGIALPSSTALDPQPPPLLTELMASLQHTLSLAKSASKGSFDLRAVADMCFQIQFEAQRTEIEDRDGGLGR